VSQAGQVRLPVELAVRFSDGTERRLRCDGRDRQATLEIMSTSPAAVARLDPDEQLPLELNPLDDTLETGLTPQNVGGVVRWLGALVGLVGAGVAAPLAAGPQPPFGLLLGGLGLALLAPLAQALAYAALAGSLIARYLGRADPAAGRAWRWPFLRLWLLSLP